MKRWLPLALVLLVLLSSPLTVAAASEVPPRPLADHPGNIFVAGEHVTITAPSPSDHWTLNDVDGIAIPIKIDRDKIDAGELPVGYYELREQNRARATTIGVIAPLAVPTPDNSPISIDVAMAWFDKTPQRQHAVASLCKIAGINWVRDRLSWPDMEPTRGAFAPKNIYDDTAKLQTEEGLKILQVNHISPPWANPDGKRMPLDLRDAYMFYREMAKRWKGQVLAFEPWNEADILMFGGHTGSEMATLQKCAYFAMKAGNPDILVCQNVFAIDRHSTLDDFAANQADAYFDTYNLHHYVPFGRYPDYYAAHRAVSAGKPMWVSECNVTVDWTGDEKLQEPSDAALRTQARRVGKIFALSIYQGSVNTFFFMLPHYVEHQRQFGLLHQDLTPRPGYMTLAAVGRLLAGATAVGKLKTDRQSVHGYLFHSMPDGKESHVLVASSDQDGETVQIDSPIEGVFDYLGREVKVTDNRVRLTAAPIFVLLPKELPKSVQFDPPPKQPPRNDAKPVPIVLQTVFPFDQIDVMRSAYVLPPGQKHKLKVFVYNFGDSPATGTIKLGDQTVPVEVKPLDRGEVELTVLPRPYNTDPTTITITGEFGDMRPLLSLRLVDATPTTRPTF